MSSSNSSSNYPLLKRLSGVILAGGEGSRLGGFKALKELAGIPLILLVVRKLQPFFGELLIITNQPDFFQPLKWDLKETRIIKDEYPSDKTKKSPLLGIYTGLKNSTFNYAFITACDMPFLNLNLIQFLAKQTESYQAVVPQINNFPEPLHAIYSRECLNYFQEAILKDNYKVSDVLNCLTVNYIKESVIVNYDPDYLSFFNLNRPPDLEKAEKIMYHSNY